MNFRSESSLRGIEHIINLDSFAFNKDQHPNLKSNSLQSVNYLSQQRSSPAQKRVLGQFLKNQNQKSLSTETVKKLTDNSETSQIKSFSGSSRLNQSQGTLIWDRSHLKVYDQFEIQSSSEEQRSESPTKLTNQPQNKSKNPQISLLYPPEQVYNQAYKLIDKTYNQINEEMSCSTSLLMMQQFLHTPLQSLKNSYMRYIFQIHLYKYTFTFHTFYEFYLKNSTGDMINILKSEKDSFNISSSHFLYAAHPYKSGTKQFIAKLKYNTAKSEYNLYNLDEKQQTQEPRRLLATSFYRKPIGDQRSIKMYIPKINYLDHDFIKSQTKTNLAAFYKEKKESNSEMIQILKSVPIPKQNEARVRDELGLKNQGRRILIVNEEGEEVLYMGKKQNERYVILASSRLTPLQIFMLAIVNLDH